MAVWPVTPASSRFWTTLFTATPFVLGEQQAGRLVLLASISVAASFGSCKSLERGVCALVRNGKTLHRP